MRQQMIYLYKKVAMLQMMVAATMLAGSCQDEEPLELDYTTEGRDVALTIPVEMPEMDIKTRADIADADRDNIKSLWIAVFSATTGEMTSRESADGKACWIKVTPDGNYNEINNENYSLPVTLHARSGQSYIVGVANVDNEGVNSDNPAERKRLSELLTDGMTWEEFNKIGVASFPQNSSVDTYVNAPDVADGLPMSGCYSSLALGGVHPADWSTNDFTPIFIPSSTDKNKTVSLTNGAIHLRRLLSHITFNITPAKDVVDVSVESYSIHNIPNYSWLYERGNAANALGANFGDLATEKDYATYYSAAAHFNGQYVTTDNTGTDPVHSFDFWMNENKHTGEANVYNDREVKHDSSTADNVLYTALTGGTWTPNNMASYVTIRCNVTYKDKIGVDDDGLTEGDEGFIENSASDVYRTGVTEYTIHLGYIGDEPSAADFNSYRNTNYTYNVNILGLREIVVEANAKSVRNSAEGIVTDVENRTIQLDAHFSCFNVAFTETELTATEDFGYIVTTYESGTAHTYTDADAAVTGDARKYIDWIELKSTTDATMLAEYKPASRGSYTAGSDAVMPIDKFHEKVKEAATNNNLSTVFTKNNDGKYYFTVFVNEYTYEPRYGDSDWGKEGDTKRWHTYVNQPSRHFYFRVRRKVSGDGNSVYARSKYAIEQQSIQTYYSATSGSGEAIGIEHTNEMQGFNLRKYFSNTDISNTNGRYNIGRWITNNGQVSNPAWSSFLRGTTMVEVPNANQFTGARLQGGPAIASVESGWNPASGNPDATGFGHLQALAQLSNGATLYPSQYDPQPSSSNRAHYIEAINACMNRNRDEDGDGEIDNAEIKWYVPASGKYLRAILGRNSLTDPIMPYMQITSFDTDNGKNTRYLLYASDDKVIWAMEGLSSSDWSIHNSGTTQVPDYDRIPWQVRCIRNLGTDLTSIEKEGKVQIAYEHDEANRKVIMTHYDRASIRTEKITAKGNSGTGGSMGMHPTTDPLNKVYYAFEYSDGFTSDSYKTSITPNGIAAGMITNNTNNPCYNMEGDSWRLPNQKELAIMRNLGLLNDMPLKNSNNRDNYAISCTYNYFTTDGKGTDQGTPSYSLTSGAPNHQLMVTRQDGGTQIPKGTVTYYRWYYRCVRDVEP